MSPASSHDDKLFLAFLFTAWHCLMRLGEIVQPDNPQLCNFHKLTPQWSVKYTSDPHPHISFHLPMHKADRLFEGSTIVLEQHLSDLDPLSLFNSYLSSQDKLFPLLPKLWIRRDGQVPTRSWFIHHLNTFFPNDNVAGHSLHSSSATALAIAGTPLECIQAIGQWSSEAFLIYLRHNPILLQGNSIGHSAFDGQCSSSHS